MQFPESDTVEANADQLGKNVFLFVVYLEDLYLYLIIDPIQSFTHPFSSYRSFFSTQFGFCSPNSSRRSADKKPTRQPNSCNKTLCRRPAIRKTTSDVIVSFDQSKGHLSHAAWTLRRRYDYFMRMRGLKYVDQSTILSRLFLPKPDEVTAFVALDKPIRRGQQQYQYLVIRCSRIPTILVNLDEETLKGMENSTASCGDPYQFGCQNIQGDCQEKKVFIPGKFANANQLEACMSNARYRQTERFILEKQLSLFTSHPLSGAFLTEVEGEFQRYAGGAGSTKNFDLCVNLKTECDGWNDKGLPFRAPAAPTTPDSTISCRAKDSHQELTLKPSAISEATN
jgi:structure-specific recognition protein 1